MSQVMVKAEDSVCRKYDKFVANALTAAGVGLGGGAVLSLLLFRRRMWPITLGLGSGLGYAMKEFEQDLNKKN